MADKRRLAKIEKAIAQEIATALVTNTKDPRATKLISITRVEITPDLAYAKVFYTLFGDEADRRTAARLFESSRGYYQSLVAARLETRTTPHLEFRYDEQEAKRQHISNLIDEALADDRGAATTESEREDE
ncbi:MAG: 30S ribosome-binding factor RbfA [Planctomycetes bacterium]|nr:30S ribosome-binding factor RbfA [Planctomycetota bacterium]